MPLRGSVLDTIAATITDVPRRLSWKFSPFRTAGSLTDEEIEVLISTRDRGLQERFVQYCSFHDPQHRSVLRTLLMQGDAELVKRFVNSSRHRKREILSFVCALPVAAPTLQSFQVTRLERSRPEGKQVRFLPGVEPSIASALLDQSVDADRMYARLTHFDDHIPVLRSLAASRGARPDLLTTLVRHEDELVRMLAAANPRSPHAVVNIASFDPSANVRGAALVRGYLRDRALFTRLSSVLVDPFLHEHLRYVLLVGLDGVGVDVITRVALGRGSARLYAALVHMPAFLEVVEAVLSRGTPSQKALLHRTLEDAWPAVAEYQVPWKCRAVFEAFGVPIRVPLTPREVTEQQQLTRGARRETFMAELHARRRPPPAPPGIPTPSGEGFVYVALNPAFPHLVKIGQTTRDVDVRMRELSAGTGTPGQYVCLFRKKVRDPVAAEAQAHRHFHRHRRQSNREFFEVEPHVVIEYLSALPAE